MKSPRSRVFKRCKNSGVQGQLTKRVGKTMALEWPTSVQVLDLNLDLLGVTHLALQRNNQRLLTGTKVGQSHSQGDEDQLLGYRCANILLCYGYTIGKNVRVMLLYPTIVVLEYSVILFLQLMTASLGKILEKRALCDFGLEGR
ncbi:hypothetical protein QR680_002742 [Steinernema hermaphroditum]|uniref:Uncharacterized protein n=1 Tax=Steinernema hermaphroditum TaxID=289476 RepID=A0AA39LIS1_9BILA|nr:hypothetical protein QR680_002742 [Steinernema hermaphroditum]